MLPPIVAAAFARQDAAERAQDERARIDRAIEAQDRREATLTEEARFETHHGYTRQELFAHMAAVDEVKEGRDPGAEYGSAKRAAVMIDGQAILSREQAARSQQTSQADEIGQLLDRAYSLSRDPYMTAQRAGWHQREIRRRQPAVQRDHPLKTSGRQAAAHHRSSPAAHAAWRPPNLCGHCAPVATAPGPYLPARGLCVSDTCSNRAHGGAASELVVLPGALRERPRVGTRPDHSLVDAVRLSPRPGCA